MTFAAPFMLAFAALMPIVIIFYFLKLKREERVVASTYLWKKSIEDLRVNSPFQKLRRNLLLFLQLLLMALATLALAEPIMEAHGLDVKTTILLIDNSASMQTVEGGKTRLAIAKERARNYLSELATDRNWWAGSQGGDRAAIVAFSNMGRLVASPTRDKGRLYQAIDEIEATDSETNISDAVQLAKALMKKSGNAMTLIFSDGRIEDIGQIELGTHDFRYIPIGVEASNTGIVAMDVRRPVHRYSDTAAQGPQVFIGLEHYGKKDSKVTRRVELYLNGSFYDAKEISLEAGKRVSKVFPIKEIVTQGDIEVRLAGDDAFSVDDKAWAALGERQDLSVALVTPGNLFLRRALELDPGIQKDAGGGVPTFSAPPPIEANYTVIVWDRIAPPDPLPPGAHILIGQLPKGWGDGATVATPVLLDWDRAHPVTRFCNLQTLNVSKAWVQTPPRTAKVLVETDQTALISVYESGGRRLVVCGFNILNSDWPIRLSFPIFFSNSIRWLSGTAEGAGVRGVRTGEVIAIRTDGPRGTPKTVIDPAGRSHDLEPPTSNIPEVLFGETSEAGIYRFRYPDGSDEAYAANLLSSDESSIAPNDKLYFSKKVASGSKTAFKTSLGLWRWLALAALLILMIEWYIYNRRIFV